MVYRGHDEHGTLLVYDEGGKRYLAFGIDDEQSCQLKLAPAQLQHVHARAMLLVLLFVPEPADVCLFGLGGGCIATCLLEHLPAMQLQAVELRPAVLDIAHRLFQLPHSPRLTTHIMDVGDFLAQPGQRPVDILFSDVFDFDGIDLRQVHPDFLRQCAALLKPGGWLVLNYWNDQRRERQALQELKRLFAEVRVCTTSTGNWIVLAALAPVQISKVELRSRAARMSAKFGFSMTVPLGNMKALL